jgi:hypothetical protein
MDPLIRQSIALSLHLVSLPFLATGVERDIPILWWTGLILLAAGGLVAVSSRILDRSDDEA